jgi:carbon-monoxide dehydrogenase medium subunit
MAFRLAKPAHLVDINEVAGLDRISSDGKILSIGARVRHAAFHKSVIDNPLAALLTHVARHIAHYPIRMRGTFCGSLAHADPASEWCLTAATLGATIIAKSTRGERLIAAADFFDGIMTTTLAEDELLAEVRLPLLPAGAKFGFNEFSRRAGDFAMAAALVTYRIVGGKIAEAHVGVGGAEPSPRRIAQAEAALNGQALNDATFRAAAEAAANAVDPLEDHQTTGEYRRDLVRAVVRRALEHSAT